MCCSSPPAHGGGAVQADKHFEYYDSNSHANLVAVGFINTDE